MQPIPIAYLAPGLALAVAALGALLCQGKRWRGYLTVVAPLAALLGWAALAAFSRELLSAWTARTGPAILLLPGVAAVIAAAVRPNRWITVALALFTAWWVAQMPAARPEFWRVWAAALGLCWLFARSVRREPARVLAAATALFAGLLLAGAMPGWWEAAAVLAAASAGVLSGAAGIAVPSAMPAALVIAADVGAGRLIRGGVSLVDAACLASCGAPFLVPPIVGRLGKRAGVGQLLVGALLAGAIAAGTGWLLQRALIR